MLAYPLSEAETLLRSKLEAAQASLANCDEDLDFLREQITVSCSTSIFPSGTLFFSYKICSCYLGISADVLVPSYGCPSQTLEVATARLYNWDVGQRRKEKSAGGEGDE
jgi:hypothetical protein